MNDDLKQMIKAEYESSLERFVRVSVPIQYHAMLEMVDYQMGWGEQGAGQTRGKRVRPMLVLFSAIAAGGDWRNALPAAWSVELIHNFSLIHDDIEDQSQLRHGSPTIWVRWGVAQAINLGDLLFNLAYAALHELSKQLPAETVLEAVNILAQACTRLTSGQYLDLAYEKARSIKMAEYIHMVSGKTAALLASSAELGAVCAGASSETRTCLHEFGINLGLAFQMWDDYLGIWGDERITGKSVQSDLISGKKSMPVLYALEQNLAFARRWQDGAIRQDEVSRLSELLKQEGAQQFTQSQALLYTQQAREALARAGMNDKDSELLRELVHSLLDRHY